MNPLEYGYLIENLDKKYFVQVNDTNIAVIVQEDDINNVKFYRKGVKRYEYTDCRIDDSTFIRSLQIKNLLSLIMS